jgi:hypothetical protein
MNTPHDPFRQPRQGPPPPVPFSVKLRTRLKDKRVLQIGVPALTIAVAISIGIWPHFFGQIAALAVMIALLPVIFRVLRGASMALGCMVILAIPILLLGPIGWIIGAMLLCTALIMGAIAGSKRAG